MIHYISLVDLQPVNFSSATAIYLSTFNKRDIAFKEEENQAGTDTDEFHQTRDEDRVKRMVARKTAGSFMVGATFTLFYFCSTTVVTY